MRGALDALGRSPGRSVLTVLGIGLAVGLVVLLLALSAGVETSASTLAYSSGIDLIATSEGAQIITGEFPPVTGAHHLATEIPAADANVVSASPWLIDDLALGNASLWRAANDSALPSGWTYTEAGTVGWVPSDNTGIEVPPITNGTGLTAPGDPFYANGTYTGRPTHEIVLDGALAKVLHVTVGRSIWVSAGEPSGPAGLGAWYANATELTVVGLSGPFWLVPSALLGFMYLSELQALFHADTPSTDYASLVLIHLRDPGSPDVDAGRIAAAIPGLSIIPIGAILGEIQHIVNLYRTFGTLVGATGLVVAALFTTTVLQMSVDDRSRELAVRRALGSTRAGIGLSVVAEALLFSGLGLAVGFPLAYLGALAMNRFLLARLSGLPTSFSFVSFDPTVIALGIGAVLGLGLGAAVLPAVRAMRLPVAEELRAP